MKIHNGKGISEPSNLAMNTENGHFGLAWMKEQAGLIGGEVRTQSGPGKGMVIHVTVPVSISEG